MTQKRTKIIATIGPASKDVETLIAMIRVGMNVARLNFSHGTYASHAAVVKNIRIASAKTQTPIGIMQDLSGPKLRLGEFADRALTPNEHVILGYNGVPILRPIWQWIRPGQSILIDDGLIELLAIKINPDSIEARVVSGGKIGSHKGVNLPGIKVDLPILSEKDLDDLAFGLKLGVDFVAQSFIRTAADIRTLRSKIRKLTSRPVPIIAKIETPEALKNIKAIVQAADVIMVARGDLALNIPQELEPLAAKNIVAQCLAAGKPVIMATQMLDSMIRYPRPTRAELSDVANAVIDHVDCLMLSGETAFGRYPAKVIEIMAKVAIETESSSLDDFRHSEKAKYTKDEILAHNLLHLVDHSDSSAIVVNNLKAAQTLARFKPEFPVIFMSRNSAQLRLASLCRAVIPVEQKGSVGSTIHTRALLPPGKRYLDATSSKQLSAAIHSVH